VSAVADVDLSFKSCDAVWNRLLRQQL